MGTIRTLWHFVILANAMAALGGCIAMGARCQSDKDCPRKVCVKKPGSAHGNCTNTIRNYRWR